MTRPSGEVCEDWHMAGRTASASKAAGSTSEKCKEFSSLLHVITAINYVLIHFFLKIFKENKGR